MKQYKRYWELYEQDNVQYGGYDPIKIVVLVISILVILTIIAIIVK